MFIDYNVSIASRHQIIPAAVKVVPLTFQVAGEELMGGGRTTVVANMGQVPFPRRFSIIRIQRSCPNSGTTKPNKLCILKDAAIMFSGMLPCTVVSAVTG